MATTPTKVEVFCSCSPKDEKEIQELEMHLRSLSISLWRTSQITGGMERISTINLHLESASIILLVITKDFLLDVECKEQVTYALKRHKANRARVIPILLRPVTMDWQDAPYGHLQCLPPDKEPIISSKRRNRETIFVDVVKGIRRVLEEITNDQRGLASALPKAHWNPPYQRNAFFTGREDLLTGLETYLRPDQHTDGYRSIALSGLGGVGKTQIALEYAYRHAANYKAILWVRAENQETLIASLVEIANMLALSIRDMQDQNFALKAVKAWLHVNTDWLLILDNADELGIIRAFLPILSSGHLLATTRAQAFGELVAASIVVDTLMAEVGAQFLLRRARLLPGLTGKIPPVEQEQQALAIARALGGLPLALDQAGAYIEEIGCSLSRYLNLFITHRAALLKRRGTQANAVQVNGHRDSVATTWSLSLKSVQQADPLAAALLYLCAFLGADAISETMIVSGASVLSEPLCQIAINPYLFDEAIKTLRMYSLLSLHYAAFNSEQREFSIHRLVQIVLRDAMSEAEFAQWIEDVAHFIDHVFPARPEFEHWETCERYLLHALTYIELVRDDAITLPETADIMRRAGWYLGERGRYDEAEKLLLRARNIQLRVSGPEAIATARATMALAWLYRLQGKYKQAEHCYQQALATFQQQLGTEHHDTIRCLSGLATSYELLGLYEKAEELYQQVLTLREQLLPSDHPDVAGSLNNLAVLYVRQRKYADAEPLYQRALSIRMRLFGAEHPDTVGSLNNLAVLYVHQRKYANAEPLYQRALSIRKQLDPEHPDTATSLSNLALLYEHWKKYSQAELLYKGALSIREQRLGSRHPDTVSSLKNLMRLYVLQDLHEEAGQLYQQLQAIQASNEQDEER